MVQDLPNGGRRLMQRSFGFSATLVNGVLVIRHGELTGDRGGHVLRRCEAVSRAPAGPRPQVLPHEVVVLQPPTPGARM